MGIVDILDGQSCYGIRVRDQVENISDDVISYQRSP